MTRRLTISLDDEIYNFVKHNAQANRRPFHYELQYLLECAMAVDCFQRETMRQNFLELLKQFPECIGTVEPEPHS